MKTATKRVLCIIGMIVLLTIATDYSTEQPLIFVFVMSSLFAFINEYVRSKSNLLLHIGAYFLAYFLGTVLWENHGMLPILVCAVTWIILRVWNRDGYFPVLFSKLDNAFARGVKVIANDESESDGQSDTFGTGSAFVAQGQATGDQSLATLGTGLMAMDKL